MGIIIQPFGEAVFGNFLKEILRGDHGKYESFKAAVAFVKKSGVQHVISEIEYFLDKEANCKWVIGIDQYGTTIEGLTSLLEVVGDRGEIFIHHDENEYVTFHPKLYLFESQDSALLIVGSGNLTQGGLYTNDEGFAIRRLDLSAEVDNKIYQELSLAFEAWCNISLETVHKLDSDFLKLLIEADYIRSEKQTIQSSKSELESFGEDEFGDKTKEKNVLFGQDKKRRRSSSQPGAAKGKKAVETEPITEEQENLGFVMTLMRTDVGTGQTTAGTSRRSPEIFIPLKARNANQDFWDWPNKFSEDPKRKGKFDRPGVKMRLGGDIITVNMMTWPVKHDFRLRSESLRSAGEIGDIIRIEKTDGTRGYKYYVEIVPQATNDYEYYYSLCINKTRNSKKLWGYY